MTKPVSSSACTKKHVVNVLLNCMVCYFTRGNRSNYSQFESDALLKLLLSFRRLALVVKCVYSRFATGLFIEACS